MKEDHFSVAVHRARAQFARAGVADAAALVERQVLTQQIESGQAYFLIQVNEESIGYCSFTEKSKEVYFLNKFYIDQTQQGKGIGKKVFELLREVMIGPKQIALQVNRRNINAINFYFKVGFTIAEAKDFPIGNSYSMDDFIMEWKKKN